MQIEDVYSFFQTPPRKFLNQELAVCFLCAVLTSREDTYGTEVIQLIDGSDFHVSDTVLYSAITFLETEKMIESTYKKAKSGGRGRPRRMMQLKPEGVTQARDLATLWLNYSGFTPPAHPKTQVVEIRVPVAV